MAEKHYFTDNSDLHSNRVEHRFRFEGEQFTFITDDGVFSKGQLDYGSTSLIEALLQENLRGKLLDLGCGYGTISVILKVMNPNIDVYATDINPRASELAQLNAKTNLADIHVTHGDRFENINQTFDVIVTNPPIRAGKKIIYAMFDESYEHLNPSGTLYVVIRRKQGAESAVKKLNSTFGNCEVIKRDRGYWVLKCIREH